MSTFKIISVSIQDMCWHKKWQLSGISGSLYTKQNSVRQDFIVNTKNFNENAPSLHCPATAIGRSISVTVNPFSCRTLRHVARQSTFISLAFVFQISTTSLLLKLYLN